MGQRRIAGVKERFVGIAVVAAGCLLLANCTSSNKFASIDPKYGVSASPRVVEPGEPVPKGGGTYRVGKPYVVAGRSYVPEENPNYRSEGMASWYGADFHGRLTANGEVYDMHSLSAAHPTLPMPSYVRVTNISNQRSVIVRVNDRGPYHGNREIDLSGKAAELLGFRDNGLARVRVEYVGRAPLDGSNDQQLMATLRVGQPAPAPSIMLASAKPFLPDSGSHSPVLKGEAPVPAGRPYDLGEPASREAALGVMRSVARQSPQPERIITAELKRPSIEPPQMQRLPVAAYASPAYDAGISTGRGLY
ncbi:MAG TPA: septal ring lytic transglycosylase RlpA family protein [Xanthobacteraceae bacterium]|jgi:rare lipoprotein A|nr:septal ring lytic transglycosylase RlpA family protein [Xanthobacteraceae bacterium]